MTAYDFKQQLAKGETGERFLDRFFGLFYSIKSATRDEQRQGIDRRFTSLWPNWDYLMVSGGSSNMPVEYKTDYRAKDTQNAFIETVSVDSVNKAGWAYSSQAAWLIYFVPGLQRMYAIPVKQLRHYLPVWRLRYGQGYAANSTYTTSGLVVPLAAVAEAAYRIIQL